MLFADISASQINTEVFLLHHPCMSSVTNSSAHDREIISLGRSEIPLPWRLLLVRKILAIFCGQFGPREIQNRLLAKINSFQRSFSCWKVCKQNPRLPHLLVKFTAGFTGKWLTMFAQAYRSRPINIQ